MRQPVTESAPRLTLQASGSVEWPQRILVAADGSPASDAAIRAASLLASLHGAAVEVVAVYAPRIPLPASASRPGLRQCEAPDRESAARFARAVRRQLRRLITDSGLRQRWPLHFHVGDPGTVLVRMAETLAPDLVVIGIHQEEPLDERARRRTAICASRYLTVPLLAASAAFEAPRRCLVAFPDGHEHRPTLTAALAVLAPGGRLWVALADALPTDAGNTQASARSLMAGACADGPADAFREVECEHRVLARDALGSILRLADEIAADLIVVPDHGSAGAMRAYLPNVTVPLLSEARASVLVVPDAA